MQALTREDIEAAFGEMGELLLRAKQTAEIAVYGGAAIMLQFSVDFHTRDVDARVAAGDHGALMRAAKAVAQKRGWLQSWLSEAVTVYLGEPGGTSLHRSYPSEARVGLRVYTANADYLLAMKLRALRVGTRDEADAKLLAQASGITSFEGMLAVVARYFPKQPLDARRRVLIGQFAAGLNAQ